MLVSGDVVYTLIMHKPLIEVSALKNLEASLARPDPVMNKQKQRMGIYGDET